jgi:hypothetical protein
MPTLKPCPHCGRLVGDWQREWYTQERQRLLFRHLAAADCPYQDCRGGVDLYSDRDAVPAADPNLPVVGRSRSQAILWAGDESGLMDYLLNVTAGRQYAGYPFAT